MNQLELTNEQYKQKYLKYKKKYLDLKVELEGGVLNDDVYQAMLNYIKKISISTQEITNRNFIISQINEIPENKKLNLDDLKNEINKNEYEYLKLKNKQSIMYNEKEYIYESTTFDFFVEKKYSDSKSKDYCGNNKRFCMDLTNLSSSCKWENNICTAVEKMDNIKIIYTYKSDNDEIKLIHYTHNNSGDDHFNIEFNENNERKEILLATASSFPYYKFTKKRFEFKFLNGKNFYPIRKSTNVEKKIIKYGSKLLLLPEKKESIYSLFKNQ